MTLCKKLSLMTLLLILIFCLFSCNTQKQTHTLYFIDNDAFYHTAEVGGELPLAFPEEPTKEGYIFEGWYFDKNVWAEPLNEGHILEASDSVYAKWSPIEYTVTFVADDETVAERTYIIEDESVDVPEIPKKDGYFGAWEDFQLCACDITVNAIYKNSANVTITTNIENSVVFNGKTEQRISATRPSIEDVTYRVRTGYKFLYYEVDGEKYTSDVISYDNVTKDTEIVVYVDYLSYELPIINVDTDYVGVHSKIDYTTMSFTMINSESDLSEVAGGIRLRGNSTASLPKKPYRIKFDKKQSLFGLEAAKSWVLLADYLDPSGLNNYTAFTLANKLPGMSFNPTPHKVNLYIDGSYHGLYTLCEQIQENDGRVGIEMDVITPDMTKVTDYNFLICMDQSVTGDEDAVYGEDYFTIPLPEYNNKQDNQREIYVELKYPEKEAFPSDEQFYDFMSQLKSYMTSILDTLASENAEAIKKAVNVNSLIDYLILDQIMNEDDHTFKSFYMYYTNTSDNPEENGKLSFGPVWDYDYSMGVPWQGRPNQHFKMSDRVYYTNIFFVSMVNVPEFYETVKERYKTYARPALVEYIESYGDIVRSISESTDINQGRWYDQIDPNLSDKNILFVKECLNHRLALLDELWE